MPVRVKVCTLTSEGGSAPGGKCVCDSNVFGNKGFRKCIPHSSVDSFGLRCRGLCNCNTQKLVSVLPSFIKGPVTLENFEESVKCGIEQDLKISNSKVRFPPLPLSLT